jgi:hypothetical protein
MKTHTPGPWSVDHSGNCYIGIIDKNERTIAFCALQNENSEEDESNSCLIASAPDLLSALEAVTKAYVELVHSDYPPSWSAEKDSEVISARKAIAKAKGNA